VRATLSSRRLSPGSSHPRAPERFDRWIRARPGMTTLRAPTYSLWAMRSFLVAR